MPRCFCMMGDGVDIPVYHENLSKSDCEEILGRTGLDGAFLIRDSETIQGAMCLCVYKKKVVYTYRIHQTHDGLYTLQTSPGVKERFFKTLEDLIKSYRKKNQGLAARLRHPVMPESLPAGPSCEDDSQDYENVVDSSEYVIVLPS
ncbi:SH2 domain-containing protein 1B2 [Paramormyrops kingsleyae]|uniref:SH2 domain-containing protein 1B2 n=1 Tax=Paramormyrops kingsleyae TaxID=1676925 RepID=UPI003B96BDB9